MTHDADALRIYMQSAARCLDLPIAPAHEASVLQNFHRIASMAALVNEFMLGENVEPAPVFKHE